jgi:AGCS family alanine or glycine:cation symporter
MCAFYFLAGIFILALNLDKIPAAFGTILHYAFNAPEALEGGLLGAVIRQGVARGLFSNEAGLGSAAMAHGAARTNEPVREGLVAMLGPFIDTIVICSITALVIVVTGVHANPEAEKTLLTGEAFTAGLGSEWGAKFVAIGIIFFSFSTLISWSYYGDRAADYLFGKRAVTPYRYIYLVFIVVGAIWKFDDIINFCDAMNGMMAIPNLVALIVLSPVIATLVRDYFARMRGPGGKPPQV